MFEFRHQPLKALFWLYVSLDLVFTIALWTVLWVFPPMRPRRSWMLQRTLRTACARRLGFATFRVGPGFTVVGPPRKDADIARTGFVEIEGVPDELVPGEVKDMARINGVQPVRVGGYWYGERDKDGKHGQKAAPGEKVLYVLHGKHVCAGGTGHPDGIGYPYLTTSLLKASHGLLKRAFIPEYRLLTAAPFSPPHTAFPAPLLDALSGYYYLVHTLGFEPANVTVEGDSAGGHLAVAFVRALALLSDARLPQLGGALLISPTADWAGTHGPPPKESYTTDWVQPFISRDFIPRALVGTLPPATLAGVWLSPASRELRDEDAPALFRDFPRTLIVAGAAELTVVPMRTLRDRIAAGGGAETVAYREYDDMTHDFIAFDWCEPQRSEALGDFGRWLEGKPIGEGREATA
ncbi:Alpha/Beta hydrolase protein [Vararia minispora EC-137]|uniref:Alpha/Beta hydrolase protein n=1 Tax=Vararia minispora EC-137 TaxID=1314806 RepID=A0ACB8QEN2_9AGAM|nr:Alpha/Beta hydrolase protein [Vararia minispora EC-137]